MITWSEVLEFIRQRLSLPSGFLEKTDEEIQRYLLSNTLPEFSKYFPDWERVGIKTSDPNLKHPTIRNRWRIVDPLGLDIFNIKECYFPLEKELLTGHPVVGPFSLSELQTWTLQIYQSKLLSPFTMFNYDYFFIPPNWIEIPTEIVPEFFVVEYNRMQPPDLSKLPLSLRQKFKEFCLAEVKIWIGDLRSKYGGGRITTPFGEIPLDGDALKSEGLAERERLINEFEDATIPPIIIQYD